MDKDVYTKAEVEHIKQGIADEVSRYCVPTCSAKAFGQMMREVEAIMQQTQARNKEMESELQAMQRSYEVTDCSRNWLKHEDPVLIESPPNILIRSTDRN